MPSIKQVTHIICEDFLRIKNLLSAYPNYNPTLHRVGYWHNWCCVFVMQLHKTSLWHLTFIQVELSIIVVKKHSTLDTVSYNGHIYAGQGCEHNHVYVRIYVCVCVVRLCS